MRSFRYAYSTGDGASATRAVIIAVVVAAALPLCLAATVTLRPTARTLQGWGVSYLPFDGSFNDSGLGPPTAAEVRAGVPFTAFRATVTDPTIQPGVSPLTSASGGLVLSGGWPGSTPKGIVRVLPYQPAWGGLLLNIVAALLAALLVDRTACLLIRASREHRHRCLNCGYPRGVSPQCTECGKTH